MSKIIDMTQVIGTDTLCENHSSIENGKYFMMQSYQADYSIRIAEDIWQSTANNIVITDGFICDIQINGVNCQNLVKSQNLKYIPYVSAIKVKGKQEGWRYDWEGK